MAILPREHEELFNKAPLVRAVTALLLVIFTLSTITRIITRWIKIGSFKSDDTFIVSSTVSLSILKEFVILYPDVVP